MHFLDGLSNDIKKNLLEELRVLWTHTSTSIEGNTLSLGETAFVLSEGLTIKGKPLKDHRDIQGHARAVDLIMNLLGKEHYVEQDLFDLHRLVINEQILDVFKPVGDWKKENNSTSVTIGDLQTIVEFSNFWDVPSLMARWLDLLNTEINEMKEPDDMMRSYARLHLSFVSIHPFYDGNGRIARLVSNLPCLKAGFPPVIIEKEKRFEYVSSIAHYQFKNGVPASETAIIHEDTAFEEFLVLCRQGWEKALGLVNQAHELQKARDENISRSPGE